MVSRALHRIGDKRRRQTAVGSLAPRARFRLSTPNVTNPSPTSIIAWCNRALQGLSRPGPYSALWLATCWVVERSRSIEPPQFRRTRRSRDIAVTLSHTVALRRSRALLAASARRQSANEAFAFSRCNLSLRLVSPTWQGCPVHAVRLEQQVKRQSIGAFSARDCGPRSLACTGRPHNCQRPQ